MLPICVLVVMMLAGCGRRQGPDQPRQPTVQVRGRLLVQEVPASGALITMTPVNTSGWVGPFPSAFTEPDGSFVAQTYGVTDGAPPGSYVLTVIWPEETEDDEPPDRLHGRYEDVGTSKLKVEVQSDPTELGTIRLR